MKYQKFKFSRGIAELSFLKGEDFRRTINSPPLKFLRKDRKVRFDHDPDLPLARIGGGARQDEADEDSLPVLAAHDVEAEAPALLVEDDLSRLPKSNLFDTWSRELKLQGLLKLKYQMSTVPRIIFSGTEG